MRLTNSGFRPAFFFILFAFSIAFCQPQKENIAVITIGGSISESEAMIMTDKLVSELMKARQFTVIERTEMDEILKEQGFQQTGCTDENCAVEIGQLLGAQKIVTGNVGKVGDIFSISLRIIDVQKGEINATSSVETKGNIEDVFVKGVKQTVKSLVDSYNRNLLTPEAIAENYKKRVKLKKISAFSTAGLAGVSAIGGIYFFARKSHYEEKYSKKGLAQADYDRYFEKSRDNYARGWVFTGTAVALTPVSVFLFLKKIKKLEQQKIDVEAFFSPEFSSITVSSVF